MKHELCCFNWRDNILMSLNPFLITCYCVGAILQTERPTGLQGTVLKYFTLKI